MTSIKIVGLSSILFFGGVSIASAEDYRAIVANETVDHIKHVGFQQGYQDISKQNNEFSYGSVYSFCFGHDAKYLAHSGNPGLIGTKVQSDIVAKAYVVSVDNAVSCGASTVTAAKYATK